MRCERDRPGELVHVDVKKVARIPDGGGHRALRRGTPRGPGRSRLHVAVDDRSRIACAGLPPDGRGGACAALMGRALRLFAGPGVATGRIMTGNGPRYRGRDFNAPLESEGIRHGHARPCSP